MGGSVSTPKQQTVRISSNRTTHSGMAISEEYAVSLVLPIYYTKENLTEPEKNEAMKTWKLISSNKAPVFLYLKENNPNFAYSLCSEYFYSIFFERLVDIHPTSKNLFSKNSQRMRQSFLSSFGMIVNLMDDPDPEKFRRCLVNLANVHNKIGIKAVEYGIVGEIIIYTIKRCCGEDFTMAAHHGWAKILSRMLDVILPVVVRYEVENAELVHEKFAARAFTGQGFSHRSGHSLSFKDSGMSRQTSFVSNDMESLGKF